MRDRTLRALADQRLDALVIGGGIVGAGIARDAALRGLKVGLIDANDFAFGTSSRSSRLLHGGIRYLAQGRIGLVREASLEKRILHQIAPHLALPLAFIFPAYRGIGWPLWQLRIGVSIYDLLCGGKNFGHSTSLDAAGTAAQLPGLKRQGLKGAVRYFDGFTQDARLVLDTLRSAANAGALAANYVRFQSLKRLGDAHVCAVRDEISGANFEITARAVVNAAGPWAQGLGLSAVQLRLTKGIHLVFNRERLFTPDAVVIPHGSRILFVLPWGERTIVGTTDTDFAGPPESVAVEEKDIAYLLKAANEFFPDAKLQFADVLSSYAGLRPLIASAKGKPSDISRSHSIRQTQSGWWDVAGGKLTTYRLMAEQTLDQVAAFLGGTWRECQTAARPLLRPEETEGISQVIPPPPSERLVKHFMENEWALRPEDVMIRRTSWQFYHSNPAEITRDVESWMRAAK